MLNRFRLRLLLSDLLEGLSILFLFFLLTLLCYAGIVYFIPVSILFKTIFYFSFLFISGILGIVFLFHPLLSYFLSANFKRDRLIKRGIKYLPAASDVFVSLFQLAFRFEDISGDEHLKEAAFVQKYDSWKETGIRFSFSLPRLLKAVGILCFSGILFFSCSRYFTVWYQDLSDYRQINVPERQIVFTLLNESLDVEYGKPFQLKVKVKSDIFPVENVFLCFGGGEFLMDKNDSLYTYDFDGINNDVHFHFSAHGSQSRYYKINVLPVPEITSCSVTGIPPAYSGLKPEVYRNVTDFRVLYGSLLKFEFRFSHLDSLFVQSGDRIEPVKIQPGQEAFMSRKVVQSGEMVLLGSNAHFVRKNLLNFTITCVPDLYPSIQVTEMQDSLRNSLFYFYGVISDDYGFSALRFNYSLDGRTNTVMPVRIAENLNTQEFYFEFDFAEFAGMDRANIHYFFEVFDNDRLSGPKSTRSDSRVYTVPDLNTIFDYNLEANNTVNTSLSEAEKLAKEIVSDVKELQKKLLDNSVNNWERQQLAKDIVEKKEKLDKLLGEVQEKNWKKNSLNQNFSQQDSILQAKQEKVQELLDGIMDEEMKKMMEEFAKLSEEFSKDQFQKLDEKMKLTFDQMSEELDRNIELLKRYQVEEKHNLVRQQLQNFKENQQKFDSLQNDRHFPSVSLQKVAKELKNKLQNIKNNYDNLLKDNQHLAAPYSLQKMDSSFKDLSQLLEKQKYNTENGKKEKGLSEKIEQKTEEISEQMEEQRQQNFMDMSLPENDIELIIQNIFVISLSQEELIGQFSGVSPQSARYTELGRMQEIKKAEYKIVKDSLSLLARSNLMLASVLNDKFYDIEIKFGLLPGYLQNGKLGELKKEQQYIVNYLNDIALTLTDALQKSKKNRKGSEDGNGRKEKGGNGKGKGSKESYEGMKKLQNGLKQQMQDLLSQMKKGEKGKPLQQGISKMIRENELFRKSLNDFMSETGSLSPEEQRLLNEIGKLLDDNIRDLANYSVGNNLMQRHQLIYNKLLLSEKASKEREEFEEKRKSVTAAEKKYKKPDVRLNQERKATFMRSDMHKSDLQLNPFFKNLYNNYYIKLGDE